MRASLFPRSRQRRPAPPAPARPPMPEATAPHPHSMRATGTDNSGCRYFSNIGVLMSNKYLLSNFDFR